MPKLEPYDKKGEYSYALGIFPSLHLLESRPEIVTRLLLHPAGENSEGVSKLRTMCETLGIREEYAERVLKREAKKDNCHAGLVFRKYRDALSEDMSHVVLCQISDEGNLGTALRALLGFGYKDVAIIRPAVDAFEPRVIRASMGAMFRMRVATFDTFAEYRNAYPSHALYPFMLDGSIPLNDAAADHAAKFALVFGNEQTGLPKEFSTYGMAVRIPQTQEIDSLNLAVAVSVGAYAFRHVSGH
ncbi:MAG: TrmH family RNA methyltransferase [Christensenellales bacterium]